MSTIVNPLVLPSPRNGAWTPKCSMMLTEIDGKPTPYSLVGKVIAVKGPGSGWPEAYLIFAAPFWDLEQAQRIIDGAAVSQSAQPRARPRRPRRPPLPPLRPRRMIELED